MWKDLAVSLSLANLLFFGTWSAVLGNYGTALDGLRPGAAPAEFAATAANVLWLGALLFAVLTALRRRLRGWRLGLTLGAAALLGSAPLVEASRVAIRYRPYPSWAAFGLGQHQPWLLLAAAAAVLAIALVAFCYRRFTGRLVYGILLAAFPFVLVTFAQAAWRVVQPSRAITASAGIAQPEVPPPASARKRVVWIVFDEWDYRLSFDERPGGLELPEVDRLRRESLFATAAYPPSEQTHFSILSFLTGKVITRMKAVPPADVELTFRDHQPAANWTEHGNLFSALTNARLRTGVVGWYLPYCNMLGNQYTACWGEQNNRYRSVRASSVAMLASRQWQQLMQKAMFSVSLKSLPALHHSQLYQQIFPPALEMAARSDLDLVLLHLPVPHGPYFFDRTTGEFNLQVSQVTGYFDNLVLMDRCVGEIRKKLEQAGLWNDTTLLISSDHWLRHSEQIDGGKDHRVPFLLKLAGDPNGYEYRRPFNTVLTHDLILDVLGTKLSSTRQAARWLDRRYDQISVEPVYPLFVGSAAEAGSTTAFPPQPSFLSR